MPAKKKTITLRQVYEKLNEHDQQFTKVINHILNVESSLKAEIAGVDGRISDLLGNFDKFGKDFEDLTQEYHAITAALRRIELILGQPEQWPDSIRSEMDLVKGRLSSLEKRMLPDE